MMRPFKLMLVALALAIGLAACGGDDDGGGQAGQTDGGQGERVTVRVGVLPLAALAPIYVGIDQGFFEEENLEVRPQSAQGGAAIVPAVVSGDFEFGYSNNVSLLLAQSQGLNLRIIAEGNQAADSETDATDAIVAPADGDIREPSDLAGATIGVNTLNNIGEVVIKTALQERGVDVSDIEFVEIPFPEMVAAVEAGRVDAGWVVEPFLQQADAADMNVLINPFFETQPRLSIATYFTSEQYARENPEVVERFTRALEKSFEFTQENPDALRASLDDFTQIPPEVAQRMNLPFFTPDLNVQSIELLAEKMVEFGLVEEQPDVQALLPEEQAAQ